MKNDVGWHTLLLCELAATVTQGLPEAYVNIVWQGRLGLALGDLLLLVFSQRNGDLPLEEGTAFFL